MTSINEVFHLKGTTCDWGHCDAPARHLVALTYLPIFESVEIRSHCDTCFEQSRMTYATHPKFEWFRLNVHAEPALVSMSEPYNLAHHQLKEEES